MTPEAIVVTEFDQSPILRASERGKRRILMQFGAAVRTTARRSVRKGGAVDKSTEGQPPIGHANELYRNFILFGYEPYEVVIGSALLTGTRGQIAPEKIEYGGTETIWIGKGRMRRRVTAQYGPRPAMRLAFNRIVERTLPKIIENSVY